jgi:hypothetical protein
VTAGGAPHTVTHLERVSEISRQRSETVVVTGSRRKLRSRTV